MFGSVRGKSPTPKPQVPSLSMLLPLETMGPLQSLPETLFAAMVFVRVAVPPLVTPPPTSAVFPLIVTLVRVTVLPKKLLIPAPLLAAFPLIVTLVSVRVPGESSTPFEMAPPAVRAVFPLKVLPVIAPAPEPSL